MVEGQLHHIVNVVHQLYINPVHQSIQSRLFKITCDVKPANETHD